MQVYGFLERAQLENVSADLSNTLAGLIWFNTTDSRARFYDSGAVRTVVDENSAQTLTGKTFTAGVITASAVSGDINLGAATATNRIVVASETRVNLEALPRIAGAVYYVTDEDIYVGDDGLNLVELGSGGAGGINYTANPDAETNANDHVAYKDSASGIPNDATGGVPALSVARSTVAPLVGKASFVITKPASNVQGEGINVKNKDFDEADKGKIHIMSFEYDLSAAGALDGDFRVYFKDETNNIIHRVNGEDIKAGKGTHYARVQVPINCGNGSLIIHCAATHINGYDFKYDRVSFGPQKIVNGAIITDWEIATVTGSFTTNTTYSARKRRVGDTAEYMITVGFSGTPNAATFEVVLDENVDVSKLDNTQDQQHVGTFSMRDQSSSTPADAMFGFVTPSASFSSNGIVLRVGYSASTYLSGDIVSEAIPVPLGAGDVINIRCSVPVQGWSSQAQVSEDFGGRDIVVEAAGNGGEVIIGNTTNIPYSTIIRDTTASWDGTTFDVPETGYYDIDFARRFTSSVAASFVIYKDGSSYLLKEIPTGNIIHEGNFNAVYLAKGEQVTFRSVLGGTLTADTIHHRIRIAKRSSSQQILETERVAARYTSNSGQTVGLIGATVVYEDLDYDTHNAYNQSTGEYIVPVTADYDIDAIYTNVSPGASEATREIQIRVNGFVRSKKRHTAQYASAADISDKLSLVRGDVVTIYGNSETNNALTVDGAENYFLIARSR